MRESMKDLDLSALKYNPNYKKSIKQLQEDHTEFSLLVYENLKLVPYHEDILRYIILVYDVRSPLWQITKDHNEKKVKAMLMAGMMANEDGRFDQPLQESLLYGSDAHISSMIVKYVYLFNNIDYVELVGMLQINFQILKDIMNGKALKESHKQLEQTSARIKQLTKDVFGGEETKDIKEKLYEYLNMSRLNFRPEHIAQRLSRGETEEMFAKNLYNKRRRK
jgi:hypothetical protein